MFFGQPEQIDFLFDGDDEDKTQTAQMLIYDPTGNNLKGSSGTRQSGSPKAYFVDIKDNEIKNYISVDVTPSALTELGYNTGEPAVISGKFEMSEDGRTVNSIMKEIDEMVLDGEFSGYEFQNIEASLSSVSVVVKDHTFGFGYGQNGDPIAYISMDKKPTFFTDVEVSGVVLPKDTAEAMNFLDASIASEFTEFQNIFQQFASAANLPNFDLGMTVILADNIEYKDAEPLTGDILDIFTPTDAANLLTTLNSGIDENTYKFVSDILKDINMELIVMMDPESTQSDLTLWLIMGITDLERSETHGLVTLDVAEITAEDIEEELGIDLPDQQTDSSIKIKFGVTGDEDFTPVLENKEVTDLWSVIRTTSDTAAGSVKTDCFAMVITLNDVITSMEAIFKTDLSTLKAITGVRNPGAGLIVDRNFTGIFDDDSKPFEEYLGLILMPDFKLDPEQLIYLTTVEGVVYDMGKFLENKDFTFPAIISDQVVEGPSPDYYDLDEVYDGALGDQTITPFSTFGYATGTTLKTVAQYAQLVFQPAALIAKSPIDVGAYHLYQPADDDYRYHTAVFNFILTKDKGPSYFLQNVSIEGFYINMSKFTDRISDAMGMGDSFGIGSLISDIIKFVGEITGDRLLSGAILAYKIEPLSMEQDFEITELHRYSTYIRDDYVKIFIKGTIKCINGFGFTPSVRCVITPEVGNKLIYYEGSFAISEDWETLPSVVMSPGDTAFFKFEDEFNATDLPAGNYTVDVYIMHWTSVFGFEKKLGEAQGTFRIFNSKEEIGYDLLYKNAEWRLDGKYDVDIEIEIDSNITTVNIDPTVFYWTEWLFIPVFNYETYLGNDNGTDIWYLSMTWPSTAWFHFYIILDVDFQGERYVVMTEIYEV